MNRMLLRTLVGVIVLLPGDLSIVASQSAALFRLTSLR